MPLDQAASDCKFAMIVPLGTWQRRPYGSLTRRSAVAGIRSSTCASSAAFCKPMILPSFNQKTRSEGRLFRPNVRRKFYDLIIRSVASKNSCPGTSPPPRQVPPLISKPVATWHFNSHCRSDGHNRVPTFSTDLLESTALEHLSQFDRKPKAPALPVFQRIGFDSSARSLDRMQT